MNYFKSEKHIEIAKKSLKYARLNLDRQYNERINNYNLNPNKCNYCDEMLPYKKKNNKFCSSSCAAKFNNRKRNGLSVETKKKISDKLLCWHDNNETKTRTKKYFNCVICGNEFERKWLEKGRRFSKTKTCSKKCGYELRSSNSKKAQKVLILKGKHKGWNRRNTISYPEKFFMRVLKNNNINYEHNYPVKQKELGLNSNYNYFLDFYMEEKKIDLEIDGKQHKYRKEHDDERDKNLIENGFIVYRIKWKNINTDNGKKYIKNEIDKFLEFYNNK